MAGWNVADKVATAISIFNYRIAEIRQTEHNPLKAGRSLSFVLTGFTGCAKKQNGQPEGWPLRIA